MDMDGEGLRNAQGAVQYIKRNFPELAKLLPRDAPLFSRGFGHGDGCSTHPDQVSSDWLGYWGGSKFLASPDVPDDFFAAGIKNSGGSEYLFVFWRIGARRFWFQDQYVVFQSDTSASIERTRERMNRALTAWARGTPAVAMSGDHIMFR